MEKHPIQVWDHLVCTTLYPTRLNSGLQDNGFVDSLLETSRRARESVRSFLIQESLLRKTDQEIKILVERHQFVFTDLLDILFSYQSGHSIPVEWQRVYEQVAKDLDALLQLLETSFPHYFNPNAKAPHFRGMKWEKELQQRLSKAKKRLAEQERNPHVLESIFDIFESLLRPSEPAALSFHQLTYFTTLFVSLSTWSADAYRDSRLSPLIHFLFTVQFNEERFLCHVFNFLKEELAKVESAEEQLHLLKEQYKCIAQILESPGTPLFPDRPSPKETVLEWINQEIYFLQSSLPKKETSVSPTSSEKIHTSLSVPVLALYLRLFKDAGIITNTNYQELFRAATSTFTTSRKAAVAHSHLHSKFYAIEESAKRKVFDQLMEMAHLCKRIG
jgi:hypothetical protein